jgi:beta-phosphoglucomutase
MTREIKAIIFDMDGVLTNSMPAHAKAWQKTFQEAGISIHPQDIYLIEGSNHQGIVETILKQHQKNWSEELAHKLSQRKIQIFNTLYKHNTFNNVKHILTMLKSKGFKLAVASGSNKTTVQEIINTCFNPDTFDVIITGDDVTKGKPSPEIYLKTINKLQTNPEECIVVENAPRGIAAAKNAGTFCIAITTTLPPQHLKHADVIVKNHHELEEYLKNKLSINF